jgi:putative ABC transport system ATP-binding protein
MKSTEEAAAPENNGSRPDSDPRLIQMQPVIDIEGVMKTYRMGEVDVHALRGVSLQIHRGEFVSIMGPSGSGKSTLMNVLGALDVPTSGVYLLEGEDVSKMSNSRLAEVRNHSIGFVFQSFNLLPRTTALTNVELPLIYAGVANGRKRCVSALEAVGLGDRVTHKPNELSGGQQQRVAIARALVNEPSIILADEPTGNLDSRSGEEIMAIFQELNEVQGITVIFVTHEEEIAEHTKRIVRLADGKIVSDEPVLNQRRANLRAEAQEPVEAEPAVAADGVAIPV